MGTFEVHYQGVAVVEAETAEEAQEKFDDDEIEYEEKTVTEIM